MLNYILLTQNNLNLLQECYNILKQCGETMFKEHGLEHNDLLRAQYKHYLAVKTGVDDLLSIYDKKILRENGVQI